MAFGDRRAAQIAAVMEEMKGWGTAGLGRPKGHGRRMLGDSGRAFIRRHITATDAYLAMALDVPEATIREVRSELTGLSHKPHKQRTVT